MASPRKEFNKQVIASIRDLHVRLSAIERIINAIFSQPKGATSGQNTTTNDTEGTTGLQEGTETTKDPE